MRSYPFMSKDQEDEMERPVHIDLPGFRRTKAKIRIRKSGRIEPPTYEYDKGVNEMSTNLHIGTKQGDSAQLIQTPTWVTEMILMRENGVMGIAIKKDVYKVAFRYKKYIDSYLQGPLSTEEYYDWKEWVEEQKHFVDSFLNHHKTKDLIAYGV